MAQVISIGSTKHIDLLKDKLGSGLKLFERNGWKVYLDEMEDGKYTFFSCHLDSDPVHHPPDDAPQEAIKKYIANAISDIILYHWESLLVKDIIRENYYYYLDEDKNLIYQYALQHINKKTDVTRHSRYRKTNRRAKILSKLMDYMQRNNHIVIDGFIRFRLKEYVGELKAATDKALDDFLLEKEYEEFLKLLKYFMEIQEPRMEMVHVLFNSGGTFKLYDDKMQPVKSSYMEDFWSDLLMSEIDREDILVSALVTIAPYKITFHYERDLNKQDLHYLMTMETLKQIFADNISECSGCVLCKPV